MPQESKRKLLLVEDEPVLALTEKEQLRKCGYTVLTASSGKEAIEAVQKNQELELILMDINLGDGIDGTEAAEIILRTRDIPIVFLSSFTDPEVVQKTEKITSYGYVVKNSNITVLDASIKMAFKLFQAYKVKRESDGKIVELRSIAEIDRRQNRVDGVFQDLSEVKESDDIRLRLQSMADLLFETDERGVYKAFYSIPEGTLVRPVSEQLGRSISEILPEEAAAIQLSALEEAKEKGVSTGMRFEIEIEKGKVWCEMHVSRILLNTGEPRYLFLCQDITRQVRAEKELREKATRLESIAESTGLGIWEVNFQTGERYYNEQWARMAGYKLEEILSITNLPWEYLAHPEDLVESNTKVDRHLQGLTPYYQSVDRIRHKDGHWLYVESRGKVVSWTEDGKPQVMYGTHYDISRLVQSEETVKALLAEKEILLKETHHRVKNNFSTIEGLLALQIDSCEEPKVSVALEDTLSRIRSMAVIYQTLYQSIDRRCLSLADFLSSIIDNIIDNFPNRQQVRLEKEFEDVAMEARTVQSLGIIMNELLTNTMKHAFVGRKSGTIKVSVQRVDSQIRLTVADDGNKLPDTVNFENSPGFGLTLVSMMTKQLKGTIDIDRDEGTRFTLSFLAPADC